MIEAKYKLKFDVLIGIKRNFAAMGFTCSKEAVDIKDDLLLCD